MPRIATVRDLSLSIAGALLAAVLLGCGQQTPPPAATPTGATLPTPRPTVTLAHTTPEPVPQRLTLCTLEPGAVSPFIASNSGSDLLALFLEDAVERVAYGWEARLVERVPSIASGDVITRLVRATSGTRYADALGFVHQVTGTEPLQLPQLVVTFTLNRISSGRTARRSRPRMRSWAITSPSFLRPRDVAGSGRAHRAVRRRR